MRLEEAKNQECGAEDAREGAYGCLRGREKEPRQEDRKETMERVLEVVLQGEGGKVVSLGRK